MRNGISFAFQGWNQFNFKYIDAAHAPSTAPPVGSEEIPAGMFPPPLPCILGIPQKSCSICWCPLRGGFHFLLRADVCCHRSIWSVLYGSQSQLSLGQHRTIPMRLCIFLIKATDRPSIIYLHCVQNPFNFI